MNKYRGSTLVDYMIPTAVVGLVLGMTIFSMANNGKLLSFLSASADMNVDIQASQGVTGERTDPINGGEFEGSITSPVKNCSFNYCSIDFGTFALNNLPSDFNDYVETTGAAGGTQRIYGALDDLAEQMEGTLTSDQVEGIRLLANMGHNMAAIENMYEQVVKDCDGDSVCIQNFNASSASMPAGYNESYSSFPSGMTNEEVLYSLCMGYATQYMETDSTLHEERLDAGNISSIYVEQLSQLMDDSTIPDPIKGVIQELSWDIGVIGEEFQNRVLIAGDHNSNTFVDPLTYEQSPDEAPADADFFQYFFDYDASTISNMDSALICAAGYKSDTGSDCH